MRYSTISLRVVSAWPGAFLIVILALVDGLGAGSVAADEEKDSASESLFDKKFLLALGGFFPAIDSTVSLSPSGGGSGGDISLQDDLGVGRYSASLYAGMTWRFLPRHQLQLEWFQLDQDGSTTTGPLPPFGDLEILNAGVSSEIDFNLGRISYGYSIHRDEKYDVSFLVGTHVATVKATVTASGLISVGGGRPMMGTHTESTSTITFPLPHIGGQFSYEFSPRWAMQFRLMAFALEISEYRGTLIEVDGTAAYQLSKHFGIGAGIKYFNLNLQSKKTGGAAGLDYQFLGPAVFGYATF